MTTPINAAAMNFAVEETMNHLISVAREKGEVLSVSQISEEIVNNPKGNTAEFFRKHLQIAYKVAIEVAG